MVNIVKREDCTKVNAFTIKMIAIILALVTSSIIIIALGYNPLEVLVQIFQGAFGSANKIKRTLVDAIPLLGAAIGISYAFRMKFWNIGGNGQILMGGLGATLVALNCTGLNKILVLVLMFVVATLFGGLWGLIAGITKVKFNANETIVTLMLNYIAEKLIMYLQFGPLRDKSAQGFQKIASFSDAARLPSLFGIHIGWIIVLVLVIIYGVYIKKSKSGFEAMVIGEGENTAKYSGIKISKTVLKTIFISGAICGIVGFTQAAGVSHTLNVDLAGNAGSTGIIIAWLANLSPVAMTIVSILFAGLICGGNNIQIVFGIPNAVSLVIQALILFFVLGSQFFIDYRVIFKRKENA